MHMPKKDKIKICTGQLNCGDLSLLVLHFLELFL